MRRSTSRCGWCRPTAATRTMPASSTRCCAASPATARGELAGLDTAALDTPDWLMARWLRNYGAETARAIALANGREPALDLTVKGEPEHWATALGGRVLPTGSVRAPVHGPVVVAAGLRRGRLVGAGRRRRAAGTAARRRARPQRRRPLRRARRQDRPARRCRRPRGRGRPRARAARPAAAESRPPALAAETVAADVAAVAGRSRSTRSCSMRRARRPAPSAAIPTSPGSSAKPTSRRWWHCSAGSSRARSSSPGRAALLVYCTCSLEPEEGDRDRPRPARPRPAPAPPADRRGRGRRPRRADQPGRRPADAALPAR